MINPNGPHTYTDIHHSCMYMKAEDLVGAGFNVAHARLHPPRGSDSDGPDRMIQELGVNPLRLPHRILRH